MTGSGASPGEMPMVRFPGLAGGDHDEQLLLEMILDGRPLPPGAAPGMRALAGGLAGLAAPGTGVLPGESAAVAAFLRSGSPAGTLMPAGGPPPRRRRRLAAGRARLAAAVAVVTVVVSGTAAAYAGALPASVQGFAHRVIGAPAPRPAAGHQPGAGPQPAGHPGAAPSAPAPGRGHRANPGKHNGQHRRHHHRHPANGKNKPKPAHPAPRAHPSHTPGPANR